MREKRPVGEAGVPWRVFDDADEDDEFVAVEAVESSDEVRMGPGAIAVTVTVVVDWWWWFWVDLAGCRL